MVQVMMSVRTRMSLGGNGQCSINAKGIYRLQGGRRWKANELIHGDNLVRCADEISPQLVSQVNSTYKNELHFLFQETFPKKLWEIKFSQLRLLWREFFQSHCKSC